MRLEHQPTWNLDVVSHLLVQVRSATVGSHVVCSGVGTTAADEPSNLLVHLQKALATTLN